MSAEVITLYSEPEFEFDQAPKSRANAWLYCPPVKKEERSIVVPKVNKSLNLAEREDFFAMCSASLWGSEIVTERKVFGEMLRGLVEQYLPETTWQLHLLANIADAQWKLRRLRKIQSSVFEAGSREVGESGAQIRTDQAFALDARINKVHSQLTQALKLYKDA